MYVSQTHSSAVIGGGEGVGRWWGVGKDWDVYIDICMYKYLYIYILTYIYVNNIYTICMYLWYVHDTAFRKNSEWEFSATFFFVVDQCSRQGGDPTNLAGRKSGEVKSQLFYPCRSTSFFFFSFFTTAKKNLSGFYGG